LGGMTEMNDTAVPFGKGIEALIIDLLQYKKIPVCFGFPAGHIDDNRALILGSATTLRVDEKGAEITFHSNR